MSSGRLPLDSSYRKLIEQRRHRNTARTNIQPGVAWVKVNADWISSGIGSIKRISHCVPPATLHTIYHGLVQSHFDYCSVVWGNCAKTLSDKLQRLQNRAVRVLTNTCYDADAN